MNTFVINLDDHVERLECVKSQLKRFGISFERFSAFDGRKVEVKKRKSLSSPFRSWLCLSHAIKGGELGCALSHLGVYRLMSDRHLSYALVLEDDVLLSKNFPDVLAMAEKKLNPDSSQVVLFSDWGGRDDKSTENSLRKIESGSCTDAYLITLSAARLLLRVNQPVMCVADAWGRWVKYHGLELFRAYPTTVRQANERFESVITNWNERSPTELLGTDGTGRSGLNWFAFKTVRALSKVLDYLLFLITGR